MAKSRTPVVLSSLVAALGGLLFGFDTAVISGTTESLQRVFALNDFWLGFAVASALIGTIVGAFTVGKPADAIGRKRTLLSMAVLYFVSALGTALAGSLAQFAIFRFIGGLAIGGASVVSPMYIAEISPARLRGRLVELNQLNIVIGILLAFLSNYVTAQVVGSGEAWRWMLGIMAVPSALFFATLFFIPESPRWLVKVGRAAEARGVLESVGDEDVEAEMTEIVASLTDDGLGGDRLLQRRYLKPILLAWAVAMLNQLSGINAMLYYAPRIFQMAGAGENAALAQAVAVGGTNLVVTIVAWFLIDRIGRRPLLLIGGIGATLSLVLMALGFGAGRATSLVLAGSIGLVASHAIGQGAVIFVFISEIFPNRVRASGQALGTLTHWVMAAAVSWTFPVVAAASGSMAFAFFACMMLIQIVFAWKIMPETKGVTLEELEVKLGIAAPELARAESTLHGH